MAIDGESTESVQSRWMESENGIDSVKEYLHVKSVWMNTGAPIPNPYAPR